MLRPRSEEEVGRSGVVRNKTADVLGSEELNQMPPGTSPQESASSSGSPGGSSAN